MNRKQLLLNCTLGLTVVGLLGACVEPRDAREGRHSESIYLQKSELTQAPEGRDREWLMQTTVVGTSSPNPMGGNVWPGYQGDLQLVTFQFAEGALQVVAGENLQLDDPLNDDDNHTTLIPRVMIEFPGEHVDVKFLETLNGEQTNRIEENQERSWDKRAQFRVDFEDATLDPITTTAWFMGEIVEQCAKQTSANLVPGSYEFDHDDNHLSFEIEVNYAISINNGCYNLITLTTGAGTVSVHYRMSFLRRKTADREAYRSEVIGEKDEVNKRFGAFQRLSSYRDPNSGLLDAQALLQRWNPDRASDDPVVYYFNPNFPPSYKPMFEEIAQQTNAAMEKAGASLRFAFKEWNDGGIDRHVGDIRYSFVNWHEDIDATGGGLLGYGPSTADPRTGELLNANVNLYNSGYDFYRFMIDEYLKFNGAVRADTCKPGTKLAPTDADGMFSPAKRFSTGLFQEMARVMEIQPDPESPDPADAFLPKPIRSADSDGDGVSDFVSDYVRVLNEYRYTDPGNNPYIYANTKLPVEDYRERLETEREFKDMMRSIQFNESPFGVGELSGRAGVEAMNEFAEKFRRGRKNHELLEATRDRMRAVHSMDVVSDVDALNSILGSARQCKADGTWETDEEYSKRIVERIMFHLVIHEFGHTLSLRHNFYGSADALHMRKGDVSSSVMDYVDQGSEASGERAFGPYDLAALQWIYGNETARADAMQERYLYCTDEHRMRSPLCQAYDLGVTPSQIVLNAIERYDWLYEFRNRRAYRRFWDVTGYDNNAFSSTFSLLRMWYMGIFDWAGGGVQDTLKSLDQVDSNRTVLTDPQYNEIARDFYTDMAGTIDLITAFYDSLLNQPATTRNYQTEFDPFFGDPLRLGIINDKLYATAAFIDLQDVYNYNPNVQTYLALYDTSWDNRNLALNQRVLDDMLGANYDTFPWFRFFALNLFSSGTNSNLVGDISLRDRIAIRRYPNVEDFEREFGAGTRDKIIGDGNPAQLFVHNGEQYIYTYLSDQGWHLVSSESRNPVSFQFMRDYNMSLNANKGGNLDNYGLKTLLAYYEFYNNFVGF